MAQRVNCRRWVAYGGATVLYIAGRGPNVSASNSARVVLYHATPNPSVLYMMLPNGGLCIVRGIPRKKLTKLDVLFFLLFGIALCGGVLLEYESYMKAWA
jgi:hypothetical protein